MSATWAEKECGQKKKHAMHWRMSIMANEFNFDEVWKPIKSVIDYRSLDYAEAVTLGGQFGKMKAEIRKLQEQNKRYRELFESISDKQMYINYTESELYRLIIAEINNFLLEENK